MSEQQYARKTLEEVIRLADEKMLLAEESLIRKDEDFGEYARSCEETIKDLDQYFLSISRQLEKWKHVFVQELQNSTSAVGSEYHSYSAQANDLVIKLRELREAAAHILSTGQFSNPEIVFDVHGCIFGINQALDCLTEFLSECLPLKFVGKLNFEAIPKSEIGTMEKLSDLTYAEILPSKLPKIKLGQLFHLDFRICKKFCEAAKRFITFSVTKEDNQLQKVCGYLQDNKNGTYILSFPITAIIPHTVNILYLGEHIRNSPYTIVFKIGPNQNPAMTSGVPNQYIGSIKDNTHEVPGYFPKSNARPMGDDRDAFKKNKWNSSVENSQQNNNWPLGRHDLEISDNAANESASIDKLIQNISKQD